MDSQTKAQIRKFVTGAAVAGLGGAVAVLATALDSGSLPKIEVLGVAMLAGALTALRLWLSRQGAGFLSIIGIEKSTGDKLAATPGASPDDGGSILYSVTLPALTDDGVSEFRSTAKSFYSALNASPPITPVEVRKFSDPNLQAAIEHVFTNSGGRNGMFFNVNLNGEIRSGVAVKVGGHLSVGGFLIKKPGLKLEGLAEATFTF